jgi:hypothetical protein
MEYSEGDGLQDQWTDESGTHAPNHKRCCLRTKNTPKLCNGQRRLLWTEQGWATKIVLDILNSSLKLYQWIRLMLSFFLTETYDNRSSWTAENRTNVVLTSLTWHYLQNHLPKYSRRVVKLYTHKHKYQFTKEQHLKKSYAYSPIQIIFRINKIIHWWN